MASAAASDTRGSPRTSAEALAGALFTEHKGRLLAIARRNSSCNEDAEEALQDALALFISRFDPTSDAPPLAWLTLTLKRRCWAIQRHRPNTRPSADGNRVEEVVPTLSDPQRTPDELAEIDDTVHRVRAALAQLKPDERDALSLSVLGYSYREIAALRGWTYTKVNRCIREGRAAMRRARPKEPP